MTHIWQKLKRPIIALAPMYGATDSVFRQIIASIGKPDVMFTEFLCVDQLFSPESRVISQLLEHSEVERPLIAQIWGVTPELFYAAAEHLIGFGFDGIDINMSCPVKKDISGGACSALINTPSLAAEIIAATKEGARGKIPVSVKTRIGFNTIVTEQWISFLLEQKLDALTIHGRTKKEMSLVPCHWDEIGKAVTIRNQMKSNTILLGNGDVVSLEDAHEKIATYGVDGVMIGRGVFHNPWVFNPAKTPPQDTVLERLELMEKHISLYRDTWGDTKNYSELKRFYKIYVSGFADASKVRDRLMQTRSFKEALDFIAECRAKLT